MADVTRSDHAGNNGYAPSPAIDRRRKSRMKAGLLLVVALAAIVAFGVVSEKVERHPHRAKRYMAAWVLGATVLVGAALWNIHRSDAGLVGAITPYPEPPSLAPTTAVPTSEPMPLLTSAQHRRSRPRPYSSTRNTFGRRGGRTGSVPPSPPPVSGSPPWESPPPTLGGSQSPTHHPSPTPSGPSPTPTTSPSPSPSDTSPSPSPTDTSPSPSPTA